MANRIMGITVEIGGDTTKLQTALKGVNGQITKTGRRYMLKIRLQGTFRRTVQYLGDCF